MNVSDYNILSTILTSAAIGGGSSLLLNALSELKDLHTKREFEKDLAEKVYGKKVPVSLKNIRKEYLKNIMQEDPDYITKAASSDDASIKEFKAIAKDKDFNSGVDYYNTLAKILGTTLGFGLSYYGANKLYNYIKNEVIARDEANDAKADYYTNLYKLKAMQEDEVMKELKRRKEEEEDGENIEKYADVSMGSIAGAGTGALLLGGLAAAIATYQILKDTYPMVDHKSAYDKALELESFPKIRFVDADKNRVARESIEGDDEVTSKEELAKALIDAKSSEEALEDAARKVAHCLEDEVNENVIRLAYNSENTNPDNMGVQNIIHAIANGGLPMLKQAGADLDSFMDAASNCAKIKFASLNDDPLKLQFAFSVAANDPYLKEIVVPISAMQVAHSYPTQLKLASALTEKFNDPLLQADMALICMTSNMVSRGKAFEPIQKYAAERLKELNLEDTFTGEDQNAFLEKEKFDRGIDTCNKMSLYLKDA